MLQTWPSAAVHTRLVLPRWSAVCRRGGVDRFPCRLFPAGPVRTTDLSRLHTTHRSLRGGTERPKEPSPVRKLFPHKELDRVLEGAVPSLERFEPLADE